MFKRIATVMLLSMMLAAPAIAVDVQPHRLLIQVDQNISRVVQVHEHGVEFTSFEGRKHVARRRGEVGLESFVL